MNGTMRAPAAPRAHWRAARPSIGGCAPRPSQLPCRRRLSPRCAPLDRASTLAAEQEQQQQEQAQIEQQQQHEQQPLQPVDEASPQPRQEQQQAEGVGVTVRRLLSLAGPLALQNVVGYSTSIVGLSYVGSMGPTVLAAYLLAASLYNLIGLSLALGLTTALDTLAGAAYGAGEYSKLGLLLQRAVIVCWATCVPVALAWANSDGLLRALGQLPEISQLAGQLLFWWIPCLAINVLNEAIKRFLQAQRLVKPLAAVGLASVVLAPVWFHLCITVAGLGLAGSALASTLIQATTLVGLCGFCAWHWKQLEGKPEQPWRGLQLVEAAAGWREYLQFGIPAALMICLEWWVYEAVVIMSGQIPDGGLSLACLGLTVNINSWFYMLPMALASAVNTSVSNALGSGDARTAAQAFRVGLALAVVLQLGLALGMATGGQYLVAMLCQDEAVRALTRSILPVLASIIVVDGLNSVISGTLRGAGRQRLGAIVNGVGCALAVPAAWLLGSSAGLGAAGLWAGVFIGAALQLVVLMSVLLRATGGEGAAGKAAGAAARQEEPARRAAAQRWWTWDWDHEAVRLQGVARTAGAH